MRSVLNMWLKDNKVLENQPCASGLRSWCEGMASGSFRAAIGWILMGCASVQAADATDFTNHPGYKIYQDMCVSCHGSDGQGVEGVYEDALVGNRSLESLANRIERTMPEEEPELCVGEEAQQVADYIYHAFYSMEAQKRLGKVEDVELDLTRLTVNQLRTSIMDVIGYFRPGSDSPANEERGLKARYHGKGFPQPVPEGSKEQPKQEDIRLERTEDTVNVNFGDKSFDPEKAVTDEFRINWEGSLIVEESGTYELSINSENGVRLFVNGWKKPVIDAWVSSGGEVREEKVSLYLMGGRRYPIKVEFFKFKDKTASLQLFWKPPHGDREVIPKSNLSPHGIAPSFVMDVPFPADDRSYGYVRGMGVSKAWAEALLQASVQTAGYVEEYLDNLAGTKADDPERLQKIKNFAVKFVERAFRRPLDDSQKQDFVFQHFKEGEKPEVSVKKVVILALKSPRFLYPGLSLMDQPDSYEIAARLALNLWDSVPDRQLTEAAERGELTQPEKLREQAWRMLYHPRAKVKLHGFFSHWMELERAEKAVKDAEKFPDFNDRVKMDLRRSLFMFVDEVFWSEKSDFRELLTSNTLMLTPELAKFYGQEPKGDGFQRYEFDPKLRSGVITHPYMLAGLAYHNQTSPIHRGVFLTRNIMGYVLKQPPAATTFNDSEFNPHFTMREKVTELTKDQSCMACHNLINPLGFSLEHFDSIGRWQDTDNQKPINTVSTLKTDEGIEVELHGPRDVANLAVESKSGKKTFIQHLFHHLVKQPILAYGSNIPDQLLGSFQGSGFHMRNLVVEMAVISSAKGVPGLDPNLASSKPSSSTQDPQEVTTAESSSQAPDRPNPQS